MTPTSCQTPSGTVARAYALAAYAAYTISLAPKNRDPVVSLCKAIALAVDAARAGCLSHIVIELGLALRDIAEAFDWHLEEYGWMAPLLQAVAERKGKASQEGNVSVRLLKRPGSLLTVFAHVL